MCEFEHGPVNSVQAILIQGRVQVEFPHLDQLVLLVKDDDEVERDSGRRVLSLVLGEGLVFRFVDSCGESVPPDRG
jgi:hypothetical protein